MRWIYFRFRPNIRFWVYYTPKKRLVYTPAKGWRWLVDR